MRSEYNYSHGALPNRLVIVSRRSPDLIVHVISFTKNGKDYARGRATASNLKSRGSVDESSVIPLAILGSLQPVRYRLSLYQFNLTVCLNHGELNLHEKSLACHRGHSSRSRFKNSKRRTFGNCRSSPSIFELSSSSRNDALNFANPPLTYKDGERYGFKVQDNLFPHI